MKIDGRIVEAVNHAKKEIQEDSLAFLQAALRFFLCIEIRVMSCCFLVVAGLISLIAPEVSSISGFIICWGLAYTYAKLPKIINYFKK